MNTNRRRSQQDRTTIRIRIDCVLALNLEDPVDVVVVLSDHYSQIATICFRQCYRCDRRRIDDRRAR